MTPPVSTEHPLEQGTRRWGNNQQDNPTLCMLQMANVNMCIPLNSLRNWLGGKVSRAYWSSLELRMCFKTLKKQNWEMGILMCLLQLQDSQFWKHRWTFPRKDEEAAAFRSLLVVGEQHCVLAFWELESSLFYTTAALCGARGWCERMHMCTFTDVFRHLDWMGRQFH